MDVSGMSGTAVGQAYSIGTIKIAHNAMKAQGEAAVKLIETAGQAAPPVGANGEGSLVNTYA